MVPLISLRFFSLALYSGILANVIGDGSTDTSALISQDLALATCKGVDIREMTIQEAHAHFDSKNFTAEDLTKCYIARIKALNPFLNAVINVNPEAISDAKEQNEGKLRGIPLLVDDRFCNWGIETTAGSSALVGIGECHDSNIITTLRLEGAVILGTTNLAELSHTRGTNVPNGWSSRGGQTKNPYNLSITPSGCSSGAAVATAANLCMASIGIERDIDNSLISPASMASCFALKPSSTRSRFLATGILTMVNDMFSTGLPGPISRTAGDLARIYDVFVEGGLNNGAHTVCENEQCDFGGGGVTKIGILLTPFWKTDSYKSIQLREEFKNNITSEFTSKLSKLSSSQYEWEYVVESEDFKEAFSELKLSSLEAQGEWVKLRELNASLMGSRKSVQDVLDYYHSNPGKEGYNAHWLEKSLNASEMTSYVIWDVTLKVRDVEAMKHPYKIIQNIMEHYKWDIMAMPSETRLDIEVGKNFETKIISACQIASAGGHPVLTIPVGFSTNGVGVGICLIGKKGLDHRLVQLAGQLEKVWSARERPQFHSGL